jgi:hypothetical protein
MQEFGYFRFLLWNSGMADEPINLVLEHLKAIRADVHEIKHVQQEQGQRQSAWNSHWLRCVETRQVTRKA